MGSKKRKLANFDQRRRREEVGQTLWMASKLTTLTLLNEYCLRMELPENVLCPPVPNRLNYLHWLKSTLRSLLLEGHDGGTVLDVGVGASCVYPLLGNKLFGWRFLGLNIARASWCAVCVCVWRGVINLEGRLRPRWRRQRGRLHKSL